VKWQLAGSELDVLFVFSEAVEKVKVEVRLTRSRYESTL
jgi:hypothetical protein